PEKRFPSCLEFIQSLAQGSTVSATMRPWENGVVSDELPEIAPGEPAQPEQAPNAPNVTLKQADAIPGYTLLECVSANPLGHLWRVQAPDGRERIAQIVNTPAANATTVITRLKQMKHPGLPAVDILRSPSGRVFLVYDFVGGTLRQRFDECRAEDLPGIP